MERKMNRRRLRYIVGPVIRGLIVCVTMGVGGSRLSYGQAQPPPPPRVNMAAIEDLKERFDQEPTVKEMQEAALKFFQVNPEKVQHYRRAAQWKAIVPDVEFTFNTERTQGNREMIDALYKQFPFKESEDNNRLSMNLGVRAHWALSRLVFNEEVLDVASLVGIQEGLLREITSLYFTRRRLMTMFALNPPKDPAEKITESIRLDEISGNLDALTGGFLTDELKKRF